MTEKPKRGFVDRMMGITNSFRHFLGPAQLGTLSDPDPEPTEEERNERARNLGFTIKERADGSTYLVADDGGKTGES